MLFSCSVHTADHCVAAGATTAVCSVPPGNSMSSAVSSGVDDNNSLKLEITVAEPLPKPCRGPSLSADNVGTPPAVMGILRALLS